MALALGVSPLAYVSLSLHNSALLKSRCPTRPSRVLSRDTYRFITSKDIPLYISLDPSQEDVRLLVVHPGQDSTDIVCSLQEVSLLKHPKFTALSYHWKAPTFQFHTSRWTFRNLLHHVYQHLNIGLPEIPITVEGRRFFVTPNLHAALHHLRQPDSPLKIWVDAICIDQANDREKKSQIPLMDKIYRQAETTYLWLGPAAEDSDTALDFIASSASVSTMDEIEALSPPYSALRALYSRTWWSRIWVAQEALLSKNSIFVCGHKQVPLHTFMQLADKEYEHFDQSRSPLVGQWLSTTREFISPWRFMPHTLPFFHLFLYRYHEQDQTPDSVYLSYDDLFSGNEWSIYTAMSSTMAFNSTLPRDRVYGLLAFASPISRAAIGVDYSGQKTDADVFKEFMVHVLKSSTSLLPLEFVNGSSKIIGLPSWALNCSQGAESKPMYLRFLSKGSFCAGDTDLVWERLVHPVASILWAIIKAANPKYGHATRTPSYGGGSTSCASFSDRDDTLILRGIFFDTISLTGPLGKLPDVHTSYYSNFEMMTIPARRHLLCVVIADACRRWEQAVRVPCPYDPYYTPQGRYEAFLRTLTVNQFEYSENALGVPLAYDIMIGRKPPSFPPETHDEMNMLLGTFVGTVAETINKRAFIITERGFLGLAPEMARAGDAVCVLQGGDVPFVVRPKGEDHWEFVGECYVHGIMQGEVVQEAKREDVKMFHLV